MQKCAPEEFEIIFKSATSSLLIPIHFFHLLRWKLSCGVNLIGGKMTTEFTLESLAKYNGQDSSLPIYLGVKGIVYDVSSKPEFYGATGGYGVFSGKEASRGLAKSSTKAEDLLPYGVWDNLDEKETKTLNEWEVVYKKKYPVVGNVKL